MLGPLGKKNNRVTQVRKKTKIAMIPNKNLNLTKIILWKDLNKEGYK
jgi:hypothetical protein